MNFKSLWEILPLDILIKQLDYFDFMQEFNLFFSDSYIYEKLCKDPNAEFWKNLYNRDFSKNLPKYFYKNNNDSNNNNKKIISKPGAKYPIDWKSMYGQNEIKICINGSYTSIQTIKDLYIATKESVRNLQKTNNLYELVNFSSKHGYEKILEAFLGPHCTSVKLNNTYGTYGFINKYQDLMSIYHRLIINACMDGHLSIIQLLSFHLHDSSAFVKYKQKYFMVLLFSLSSNCDHLDIIDYLYNNIPNSGYYIGHCIENASCHGYLAMLEYLLDPSKIQTTYEIRSDSDYLTLENILIRSLCVAFENNHKEIVEFLLKYNINIEKTILYANSRFYYVASKQLQGLLN